MTDTMKALEAEAKGTKPTVSFKTKSFTLPESLDDADGDFLYYIDQEKVVLALSALLGPEQFSELRAEKPTVKEYTEVLNDAMKAVAAGDAGK